MNYKVFTHWVYMFCAYHKRFIKLKKTQNVKLCKVVDEKIVLKKENSVKFYLNFPFCIREFGKLL